MELFDKKFVHFMWDDELEGKEGFVSRNIKALIDIVNLNDETALKPLTKELTDTWAFVYYDPLYNVKRAYNEGKPIESRCKFDGKWYVADATSSKNYIGSISNWNTKSFTLKSISAGISF